MTKTTAYDTILDIVKNHVEFMDDLIKFKASNTDKTEAFIRLDNELRGMMICLKNIAPIYDKRIWSVNYLEDGIEFGYYMDGIWVEF